MERDRFLRKVDRFVEDHVLEADLPEVLVLAGFFGTLFFLRNFFNPEISKAKDQAVKVKDYFTLRPLGHKVVRELGEILRKNPA